MFRCFSVLGEIFKVLFFCPGVTIKLISWVLTSLEVIVHPFFLDSLTKYTDKKIHPTALVW